MKTDLATRACLGAILLFAASPLRAADAPEKPNVVVIFCDDLGYADVGCFGSPKIKTPRLDKMAAEGMRFTSFYAAPLCTPSRAALLTGCYAPRVGLPNVLLPSAAVGINDAEITIAELLKSKGYATACIGKWHLGDAKKFLPTQHGFDYYFGVPYSNDMRTAPLLRNTEVIERTSVQETLTERYTEEAVRFITANKDKPFFVYLPHTFPHTPLHASERFKGKSERGLYGDVVETIDWGAGEILDALQKLNLDKKTLVIFTSDNGPWLQKGLNGGSALPLRAGKATTYEGGVRVPCIMRWPDVIPAAAECKHVAATIDLLPTLAVLAGAEVPKDRVIDGKNILPLMKGDAAAQSPHEAYFYFKSNTLRAVRSGKWKLVLNSTDDNKDKDGKTPPGGELYNLDDDIGERKDLAAAHPEIVERLTGFAAKMKEDMAKNARPAGKSK